MTAKMEFADSEFLLDICTMKEHQDKDTNIQKLSKRTNTNWYTSKEIEGVFLIHNNNRTIVPEFMKDKVLQWYHLMQVHPGEK